MNKSIIPILMMLACSTFFFSGCVIPANGYYFDPYYSPSVVVVPALPYTVNLYDRDYYSYRGYNYFYSNQRWYYSKTKGGNWTALPRTHWPHDTERHGRHFYNNHNDYKHGAQKSRPPQKIKYRAQEHPRRNDKSQPKKDPRYKNARREDLREHKKPMTKDKRRDEKATKKKPSKKSALASRQHQHDQKKKDRNTHKQSKVHTPKDKPKQSKDGKNRTNAKTDPNAPEFKRR